MANVLFPTGKEYLLSVLSTDTVKVALLDASYTYSAAHQFFSSVSSAVVGTPVALGSKTVALGVFNAATAVFTAVTGNPVTQIVIYKDTGVAGTSNLLVLDDTVAAGLPITPNGGDITITWSTGASKIFAL